MGLEFYNSVSERVSRLSEFCKMYAKSQFCMKIF